MTIYRVFLQRLVRHRPTNRSDMDHTVLPANYTMPAFVRKRSPDGATALSAVGHSQSPDPLSGTCFQTNSETPTAY